MKSRLLVSCIVVLAASPSWADPGAREFLDEAKALIVVGACADGAVTKVNAETVAAHCRKVKAAQDDYKKHWLALAQPFFTSTVPATVSKTVVYPFAGGDLASALAVFPEADEITTLSLEPAGDPLALGKLSDRELRTALGAVATELTSLYRYNFSVTMKMIDAMRAGALPTQLIFSLSALSIFGYEPTSMRYFQLTPEGDVHYLTETDVKNLEDIKGVTNRNREFANVEIRFKKPGGHEQIYRHIMANLDDPHLKRTPAALKHLEKKGHVTGMTKAASYLLTFDEFATMRQYIAGHVDWMVSDSTGLPPAYGTPAGFEYETYGVYESSNMKEGKSVTPAWRKLYSEQPKRELKFRFGYPDGGYHGHLIIMRRSAKPR